MLVRLVGMVIMAAALQGCVVVAAVGVGMALAAGGVTVLEQASHDEPTRAPPAPDQDAAPGQGG